MAAVMAAILVINGVDAAECADDEAQLPIGVRSGAATVKGDPSVGWCKLSCEADCDCHERCSDLREDADCDCCDGCNECADDEDCTCCEANYQFFCSSVLFPDSTQQVVEVLIGPLSLPMVDGGFYSLPQAVYMRLGDGSIWRINEEDVWLTQDWLSSDPLHLMENKSWFAGKYHYYLYNTNTCTKVRICPEMGPKHSWALRRYIHDRNLYTNEVVLNDGSFWKISSMDSNKFANWLPDDSILVGVNDDWLSYKRPNLLINLTTNDCVRAAWVQ